MSKYDVVDMSFFVEDMQEMLKYALEHRVRPVYYVAECCCITHVAANNYINLYYGMAKARKPSN